MGAEIKTNLCVFFETILYIVSFPSSTFHSAIYWTPWWAIQWEVRDLLGHLKVRVGHIVSNKWWENITLWASEFTIFLKCARSLITKIIVECVSSLAMDIHKKKTFYAGDKTFIEGKAASFLYCSISHGLTSDIYEKLPPFDIHLYFVGSSNLHQLQLISQYWLLYTQQGTTCHQNKYEIALVWKSESVQFWFVDEKRRKCEKQENVQIYHFYVSWQLKGTYNTYPLFCLVTEYDRINICVVVVIAILSVFLLQMTPQSYSWCL